MARLLLVLWLPTVMVPVATPLHADRSQQPPASFTDYVEINGKRNPELIPEWVVWKQTFLTLSAARSGNLRGFTHEFEDSFSPAELKALYAEVDAQARRDQQCLDGMERTRRRLDDEGVEAKTAARELFDVELRCRQRILDARDRLIAVLSPESLDILRRFADETRSSVASFVPRSELEQFRLPQ